MNEVTHGVWDSGDRTTLCGLLVKRKPHDDRLTMVGNWTRNVTCPHCKRTLAYEHGDVLLAEVEVDTAFPAHSRQDRKLAMNLFHRRNAAGEYVSRDLDDLMNGEVEELKPIPVMKRKRKIR